MFHLPPVQPPLIGVVNFVHSCTIALKTGAVMLELCGHGQCLRSYLSHYELSKLGKATKYLLALTHFMIRSMSNHGSIWVFKSGP